MAQVHPGVIKSDFLERAQFRGEGADAQRDQMEKILDSGMAQKPEEIADAVIQAVEKRKNEVIVGSVFQMAVSAYRLTGVNPF